MYLIRKKRSCKFVEYKIGTTKTTRVDASNQGLYNLQLSRCWSKLTARISTYGDWTEVPWIVWTFWVSYWRTSCLTGLICTTHIYIRPSNCISIVKRVDLINLGHPTKSQFTYDVLFALCTTLILAYLLRHKRMYVPIFRIFVDCMHTREILRLVLVIWFLQCLKQSFYYSRHDNDCTLIPRIYSAKH